MCIPVAPALYTNNEIHSLRWDRDRMAVVFDCIYFSSKWCNLTRTSGPNQWLVNIVSFNANEQVTRHYMNQIYFKLMTHIYVK